MDNNRQKKYPPKNNKIFIEDEGFLINPQTNTSTVLSVVKESKGIDNISLSSSQTQNKKVTPQMICTGLPLFTEYKKFSANAQMLQGQYDNDILSYSDKTENKEVTQEQLTLILKRITHQALQPANREGWLDYLKNKFCSCRQR